MSSSSDISEKLENGPAHSGPHAVSLQDVDVAAHVAGDAVVKPLTPEEAQRLRRKIDWHLMPLMCILYLMTFADKTTLGQSAVLGIIPSNHLTQNQFNWLGTIFSLSFLVFEYPQNLALQYFPVGKWMSLNIFVWAVALLCHAACSSFAGLFVVRFILGMCEGAITPGFMIVTSMFYTREEQTRRVGYWFLMNGFAIIFLGFTSYGVLHTKTPNFKPWQWLMVITGLITLIVSVVFYFFFPDSPTNARFLTKEERIQAIERIKVNQSGVENKRWKKDQVIETLKDPKVWVMAAFAAIVNIPNSLINQRQIIVSQFGFTPFQTTLIGCVDGVVEILTIWLGVSLTRISFLGRGYTAVMMFVPALLGSILVNTLQDHNKIGLLFSYWVSVFFIVPFPIFLGWVGSVVSGHTKRTTTNAIVLIAYSLGNAAGPFMWKKQYQPRNHIPWAVISSCITAGAFLILVLRTMLARENARREKEERDETYDDVYIQREKEDGTKVEQRVDKVFLDLTDIQNRDFRYVL